MHAIRLLAVLVTLTLSSQAFAQGRLPTIPPEQYTPEQKQAVQDFETVRKAALRGPFQPLLHSPQVMTLMRSTGDYLRYKSAIGTTLSELVILVVAREWTQDYEWMVHQPIAVEVGIKASITEAIAQGRRPQGMSDDEEIVYDFSTELHKNKHVSDYTYARAEKRFGKQGVVDLTAINAYYTSLAMQMNAAEYQVPKDAKRLQRFPR